MNSALEQPLTANEARDATQTHIRSRLPEAAGEIIQWRKTGLLPDGVVRSAAAYMRHYFDDHVGATEYYLVRMCLDEVGKGAGPAVDPGAAVD